MKTTKSKKRSLGGLRPATKSNPKAPEFLGSMRILKATLTVLMKQLNQSNEDEIIANLAAWKNQGATGPFLTVEISPRFVAKQSPPDRNSLEQLFTEQEN